MTSVLSCAVVEGLSQYRIPEIIFYLYIFPTKNPFRICFMEETNIGISIIVGMTKNINSMLLTFVLRNPENHLKIDYFRAHSKLVISPTSCRDLKIIKVKT